MTPCSLANVHRWVWKKGGGIDERRERKDSSQVRKNKRAWKRRKKHVIELKYSLKEESRKKREKNTFVNTLQRLASASLTTHTHTSSSCGFGVSSSREGFASDSEESLVKAGADLRCE